MIFKKNIKNIVFLATWIVFSGNSNVTDLPSAVNMPTGENPLKNKAEMLSENGQYIEALKVYEEILKNNDLSIEEQNLIESSYRDLNFKILFSKTKTETSKIHIVRPGDSLYKLAAQYNTTVELIKNSNGLRGDTIYPDMRLKIETAPFSILVDKSDNILILFMQNKPIKKYLVATGENSGTPAGEFKIINKLVDPTWFNSGAIVSPDNPDNILGTRWMGFDYPGYGIHGTTIPESIGTQATAGCIRMLNEEVEELYGIVPTGTVVSIKD